MNNNASYISRIKNIINLILKEMEKEMEKDAPENQKVAADLTKLTQVLAKIIPLEEELKSGGRRKKRKSIVTSEDIAILERYVERYKGGEAE